MDDTLPAELARTVATLTRTAARHDEQRDDLPRTGSARYREGPLIGRGGMGKVVEAEDLQFGRKVALKTMLGAPDDDRAQRFGLEAIVTANLEHPGIPAVFERGRDPHGAPFYAMRLIRGRSLKQAIADARDLDARLRLLPALIDVAQTLAFAHARGVIHRDIKPDNVVVGAFGDTVVIDWGVAKLRGAPDGRDARLDVGEPPLARAVAEAGGSTSTRDGAIVGTPAYMAPEQAAGTLDAVDERSDVFSLGALLYHLFTGHPPYRGQTSLEALTRALACDHEPLARAAPDTPAALVEIVERAMARDPSRRYPTAGALADALQEVLAAGVRERGGRAVRLFADATSLVLTLTMLALVGLILATAPLADLGLFAFLVLPTFALGAVLAAIEWWTLGRHGLSPLILGLAVVTTLEGLVGAALGRTDIAAALVLAAGQQPLEPVDLGLAYMKATQIFGLTEAVGLQFGAALIVLHAVTRYRISAARRATMEPRADAAGPRNHRPA